MVIKQRSPNYPGMALGEAIEALKILYPKVQRQTFTALDAAKAWGGQSVSGPVGRKIAALRQFGLVDGTKLSTRALTLLLRNPASNEYRAAIREVALEPPLFREMVQSKRHLVADDELLQHLIVDRGFTNEGATQFSKVLRATMVVAGLTESDKIASQEEAKASKLDEGQDQGDTPKSPDLFSLVWQSLGESKKPMKVQAPELQRQAKQREQRVIQFPLGENLWAAIQLPTPLTTPEWAQFVAVLEAMKPGLIEPAKVIQECQEVAVSPPELERLPKLTKEAQELLTKVNDGGIPLQMTANLKKIAAENGIKVTPENTPNDILEGLRALNE